MSMRQVVLVEGQDSVDGSDVEIDPNDVDA
jgi:hypothetical protein